MWILKIFIATVFATVFATVCYTFILNFTQPKTTSNIKSATEHTDFKGFSQSKSLRLN